MIKSEIQNMLKRSQFEVVKWLLSIKVLDEDTLLKEIANYFSINPGVYYINEIYIPFKFTEEQTDKIRSKVIFCIFNFISSIFIRASTSNGEIASSSSWNSS